MKSLFALIGVTAVVAVTGGLYYATRPASDRQYLKELSTKVWTSVKAFGMYMTKLFVSDVDQAPAAAKAA